MKPGLEIRKIWEDEYMMEVVFKVCDGKSVFAVDLYVGHGTIAETVECLNRFTPQIQGGIYDLEWGGFGSKSANGAVKIRFQFHDNARLFISGLLESEYTDSGSGEIASRGELFFYSEPALLDDFVGGLGSFSKGALDSVSLSGKI